MGIFAVLVFSAFVMLTFLRYCELIAKFEGREDELKNIHSDENGLNEFRKEHWYKLSKKPYLQFQDIELSGLGNRLQYLPRVMGIVSVMIVFAAILSNQFSCN